jgi:hypothetical protein
VPLPRTVAATLSGWLSLEQVALAGVIRPTLRLAGALAVFDDRVLDRVVLEAAVAGRRLADLVNGGAERSLDGSVTDVARGARRLAGLARRPQTGLLHQYYAQAVVGIVLLALFLVLTR